MQGNIPVIPTPFLNGRVEYAGLDRLIEHTVESVDGYVVCGSTGEAPAMTRAEREDVIRYVAGRTPAGKHLVVGLGHTCLEEAVEIGLASAEAGVRAALVPSPYYFPNSMDMVIDYVGRLGERTGLDIVFYDNPVTTGTRFTTDDLVRLADSVPQIKGIKMTDHSFEKMSKLKQRTQLTVFGGDDIICFRAFEAGVDGSMIIAPLIYPEAFRRCWEQYRSGDVEASYELYCEVILPFLHLFGPGDEIPTTKWLFQHLGLFSSAEVRSPLLSCTPGRIKQLKLGYQQGLAALNRRSSVQA